MALLRPLYPLILFTAFILLLLSVFRTGYVVWQWDRVDSSHTILSVVLQGLRFDTMLLGFLLLIPATLSPLVALNTRLQQHWNPLLRIYLLTCMLLIAFLELSTPSFIAQYDARPNFLFVEYLKYPQEVFSTLWSAYKFQLIITALTISLLAYFGWQVLDRVTQQPARLNIWQALTLSPVLLLLCILAARSTLDHRPINPSMAAISEDPMVNDLALNSFYSLAYAIYESRRDESGGIRYGNLSQDIIDKVIRNESGYNDNEFTDKEIPSLHNQKVSLEPKRQYNLVIILEESLGAEFVGALGGKPLTPNLDSLKNKGIWFEHLYATGTRSVRGIEAVITGFPPTPARSVVKLSKTQRHFFTIAKLLEEKGYATSFIYGGESHFDNMGRFFANNGFQKIVDKAQYKNPVFTGSWGVSDEDLFNKAHEEFLAYGNHPFFSLVFTSSNHSPFEFPDGRIELIDKEKNTVNNAVKYADYALGNYLKKAMRAQYWNNTIFLIVADHNSRVYGPEIIPISRFHIPGLILGADLKSQVFRPIASQIDLAPTLLTLMGISNENPMIGHDLTLPRFQTYPGRALLQYNSTFGYLEGNHLVVLQKNHIPEQFTIENEHIDHSEESNTNLVNKALSYSLWASKTIDKQLYHLPFRDQIIHQ